MKKSEKKIFWWMVITYLVFLIIRIISDKYLLHNDSDEYLDQARIIHNFLFSDSALDLSSRRPFMYPLFLAFLYKTPYWFIVFMQTFISLASFYLMVKIIHRFGYTIDKLLYWMILLTPSIFVYTHLIMSEVLVAFFLTLLFWILLQPWSKRRFIYIQIIVLLLAFIKPVFYPLIYFNLIFFIYYFIKNKVFSPWLFVPVIVLQLYMHHNEQKFGYRHFSDIENFNLINYNMYFFMVNRTSIDSANHWMEQVYSDEFKAMSPKDQNDYLHQKALEVIKNNFFSYSFYHLSKAIFGIIDPGRYDLLTYKKKRKLSNGFLYLLKTKMSLWDIIKLKFSWVFIFLVPIFFANLVKWYYFFRFTLREKLDLKVYYFIAILILYILITGPVNVSRYMMPFQFVVIALAYIEIKKLQPAWLKFFNRHE